VKWFIALSALCLLPALAAAQVRFVDATRSAGIDFHHRHGGTGEKYPMETMGSGAVFFDYDLDGWLDLYFVNSAGPGALYHNGGDGTDRIWHDLPYLLHFASRAKRTGRSPYRWLMPAPLRRCQRSARK